MIIVAVEEISFLLAVGPVVGGVEVEDQMSRRCRVDGDELIDEDSRHLNQGLAFGSIFEATKGGW